MQSNNPESWPVFYYSAWYYNPLVQQHLMPSAMPVDRGLEVLAGYQEEVRKRTGDRGVASSKVLLHRVFVDGMNDSQQELESLVGTMGRLGLVARINSLRFSKPPGHPYGETPEPRRSACLTFLKQNNPGGFKEIERAGHDVSASCGVFLGPRVLFL
jgi:adenine C2-methylase RlmN of 23S rRNA A2503 and tRNA A37